MRSWRWRTTSPSFGSNSRLTWAQLDAELVAEKLVNARAPRGIRGQDEGSLDNFVLSGPAR